MFFGIASLADQFLSGDLWNRLGGPDLAVRMRITGTHHGAAILEDLHVIDLRQLPQLPELGGPGMDHVFNVRRRHSGKGKVVARGKADYPAQAGFAFRDQQSPVFDVEAVVANRGFEGGKVIVENEGAGVARIEHPADPRIARAKVAGGIIFGLGLTRYFLELPLPRPARAMWRYQHPLVGKRV